VLRIAVIGVAVLGCSSAHPTATTPPPRVETLPRTDEAVRETAQKSELAAAHRVLEDEQAVALAATCEPAAAQIAKPRCEPSCYRSEPADPRAGKKHGRAEIVHLVCRSDAENEALVFADEIGGSAIAIRPGRGRVPKAANKATWQAEVESAVIVALQPERRDAIRVTSTWKAVTHPLTKERLRCVTVSHHVMSMRRKIDACGARGGVACEANGNAAAHGINVVHYRLAEARQLLADNKTTECQQAALEAIAVARGLPRWRQYVAIQMNQWKAFPRYRTRFDGILDEDTLFATAATLGVAAQEVYVQCGGAANPPTSAAQEQSFHTCW
jgi:hypothetical protein